MKLEQVRNRRTAAELMTKISAECRGAAQLVEIGELGQAPPKALWHIMIGQAPSSAISRIHVSETADSLSEAVRAWLLAAFAAALKFDHFDLWIPKSGLESWVRIEAGDPAACLWAIWRFLTNREVVLRDTANGTARGVLELEYEYRLHEVPLGPVPLARPPADGTAPSGRTAS